MKKYLLPSLRLSLVMLVLCCGIYFGLISWISKLAPGAGSGERIMVNGRVVGYERLGQRFTQDRYFQGRPSAVAYNAAGSAGSNKGPGNVDYLVLVKARIDTLLAHNRGIEVKDIPAELVTASGSGLDPELSPAGALIQVKRVANVRGISEVRLRQLVNDHTTTNPVGPDVVHVLKLNIALDALK